MFIAFQYQPPALQRSAMCLGPFRLHSAPNGAGIDQEAGAINMLLLRSKHPRYLMMTFRANLVDDISLVW